MVIELFRKWQEAIGNPAAQSYTVCDYLPKQNISLAFHFCCSSRPSGGKTTLKNTLKEFSTLKLTCSTKYLRKASIS